MQSIYNILIFSLIYVQITAAQNIPPTNEYPVIPLPLGGPMASKYSEISGMAWYGDRLIILPQYPDRENISLFSLSRKSVEKCIENRDKIPLAGEGVSVDFNNKLVKGMASSAEWELVPERLSVDFNGLFNKINGYEGFESIGFKDSLAFLTIECKEDGNTFAWLIRGIMRENGKRLVLDTLSLQKILPQADLRNFSEEALVYYKGSVYTFYEANGLRINPGAVAHRFTTNLRPLGTIPLPPLEYRLTDATEADTLGRFWVINYLWPRERFKLKPAPDSLLSAGGVKNDNRSVERLIEFRIGEKGIHFTARPPVYLRLLPDDSRNWEGIVRLPGKGFLLATDEFPKTILAFVPFPLP